MQVSGSAIDRVFTPPVAPPRRFRGAIDAALTLAVGSVCAFALTLGPAPLNTVAASSAAAASFAGHFDTGPQVPLLPAEVDGASADDTSGEESAPTPTPSATSDAVAQSPAESSAPQPTAAPKKSEQARQPEKAQQSPKAQKPPKPHKPNKSNAPELISPSAALSVVQDYRLASGLAAFVSADECTQSKVHASVTVTPSALLPPGLAKKSLAPDPAYATVSGSAGSLTVTVHACG